MSGMLRDQRGQFLRTHDAMARFVSFCRFDPGSGCVIWTEFVSARDSGQIGRGCGD